MATIITPCDERLVERDEVLFPKTDWIDTEPFYRNFTSIQNHSSFFKSHFQPIHSINNPSYSSRNIDGQIFNLIRIVEDIGYNSRSPFIHFSSNNRSNNELFHLILHLGGAHGPLVSTRRLHLHRDYFQRWYLEKYSRSASLNRSSRVIKKTTQKSDDNQSHIYIHRSINTSKQMDEKHFQNDVLRMYGFEDSDTASSVSSRRSSLDEIDANLNRELTPIPFDSIEQLKPKQQITIREYYPSKDMQSLMVDRSLSSSQQTLEEDEDYEQLISNHPELYSDPNPERITKANPDHVTYQQNVSVRYLVPPTPPPPGPLIIREILPPRQPTPPPLIIQQQEPTPPTPPPLILREVPPTPPPHQEAKIITKMLPQPPPSLRRVIMEQTPPLPPKPQSIIIEKWLPYKPPPPREIIYERVIETPVVAQFQPSDQQHRRSKSSSRLAIPVHIERTNSFDHLNTRQSLAFDQFTRFTQQQLERIQTHQQWMANQHRQHMNMVQQFTTPALIVHHPPVTRTATAYAHREEFLYQPILIHPTYI